MQEEIKIPDAVGEASHFQTPSRNEPLHGKKRSSLEYDSPSTNHPITKIDPKSSFNKLGPTAETPKSHVS